MSLSNDTSRLTKGDNLRERKRKYPVFFCCETSRAKQANAGPTTWIHTYVVQNNNMLDERALSSLDPKENMFALTVYTLHTDVAAALRTGQRLSRNVYIQGTNMPQLTQLAKG